MKIETETKAKVLSFLMLATFILFGFFCFGNFESPITEMTPSVTNFFSVNVFGFDAEPIDKESFSFKVENFFVHLFIFFAVQTFLINLAYRVTSGNNKRI